MACAYGGYCDAATYEELYYNFMASPYTYMQAVRYRNRHHHGAQHARLGAHRPHAQARRAPSPAPLGSRQPASTRTCSTTQRPSASVL
jgi:hypothetical protein